MLTQDQPEAVDARFYVTGGSLRQDAPSYVERQADRDLYEALQRGEFCYILTSRQMGKSSLMIRTAIRLREAGVAVASLDLTGIGQHLTVEQWYDGLLRQIGIALDLEDELEEFWFANEPLGPLQRWLAALSRVVLVRCPGPVVIFIDEIDTVRSLPFSTDEFFAAIRQCYNRRVQEPEFARLTFCLLGVASPSDLIRDTRLTPFNIGQRIELTDFTAAEAVPLAQGLAAAGSRGIAALKRVLHWTGGHPYLTQRLCRELAEAGTGGGPNAVDRLAAELFLTTRAQERDDNLLFVRERLLHSEADRTGLLDLYSQVRSGRWVRDDATSPLVSILRLSGAVRSTGGCLRVRNRIYERVFDQAWVAEHMPDAERRRQRAAYTRGLWRAGLASTAVLLVVAGLAFTALGQARRAETQSRRADRIARQEAQQRQLAEGRLYVSDMLLAQRAWEMGDVGRADELLDEHFPKPGGGDLRGFEWRRLWWLCRREELATFWGHTGEVSGVAFSPDGRILATASEDSTVKLWEVATRHEIATLKGHKRWVNAVAFSPDGTTLASASDDRTIKLWDVDTRREIATLRGHGTQVWSVVFSPDASRLASCSPDNSIRLWDVATRRQVRLIKMPGNSDTRVVFSPDGATLATTGGYGCVRLWNARSGRLVAVLGGVRLIKTPGNSVTRAVFSADGEILTTTDGYGRVRLWNARSGRLAAVLGDVRSANRPMARGVSVAFSPNGRFVAMGCEDRSIKLWDVRSKQALASLKGHTKQVNQVAFSPDGRYLASAGGDGIVKLWDVAAHREVATFLGHTRSAWPVAFSPDGRFLASGSKDTTVRLWSVAARSNTPAAGRRGNVPRPAAFATDLGTVLTLSQDGTARLRGISEWLGTLRGSRPWTVVGMLIAGGHSYETIAGNPPRRITSAAISGDQNWLAMSTESLVNANTILELWNLSRGAPVSKMAVHLYSPVVRVIISPDGRAVAAGDGTVVKLWDIEGRRVLTLLSRDRRGGSSYPRAFSPDGKILATAGVDISLWDVATGKGLGFLSGHDSGIHSLAFSPDGRTLASASEDNTVKLWDVAAQREVATLRGHADGVRTVVFSPDGRNLASGSTDGSVKLWSTALKEEVMTLSGRGPAVVRLAFSPDGKTLAAVNSSGRTQVWQATTLAHADARQRMLIQQPVR